MAADAAGNLDTAIHNYTGALDYLHVGLTHEKDPYTIQAMKQRQAEYRERAEYLKAKVEEHRSASFPSSPRTPHAASPRLQSPRHDMAGATYFQAEPEPPTWEQLQKMLGDAIVTGETLRLSDCLGGTGH